MTTPKKNEVQWKQGKPEHFITHECAKNAAAVAMGSMKKKFAKRVLSPEVLARRIERLKTARAKKAELRKRFAELARINEDIRLGKK